MTVTELDLPGVLLIEPRVFTDERGAFFESWHADRYREAGIHGDFVQDNLSVSRCGVLRGLHFQEPYGQAKLVSVLRGEVYDVAVDVRVGSPTFGRSTAVTLSDAEPRQLFVPAGFAHGFLVLSDEAVFSYKCTELYHPEAEQAVRWDDPDLAIAWPEAAPVLSPKDRAAPRLRDIPESRLPRYRGARAAGAGVGRR